MVPMEIADATGIDIAPAVRLLVKSFALDPQIAYLFGEECIEREQIVGEFFSILLAVRVKLATPALLLKTGAGIGGVAMGYDTRRPSWPPAFTTRWNAMAALKPANADRLAQYDGICSKFEPRSAHYYLGVVGVDPSLQGQGAGTRLIEAFTQRSSEDPASTGVFLDTANPINVAYYRRRGFNILGTEALDDQTTLSCLFRPTP